MFHFKTTQLLHEKSRVTTESEDLQYTASLVGILSLSTQRKMLKLAHFKIYFRPDLSTAKTVPVGTLL
jgi:hypothetical protein